ncbi:MAG: nucleoside-diphosphate sugar epimerase/dehydratase, partial [Flammeovirgaceae bacterium]
MPSFFVWKIGAYYFRKLFAPETEIRNYLLIGRNPIANQIRKYYLLNPQLGYKFKGNFDADKIEDLMSKIKEFSSRNDIHEIFFCATGVNNRSLAPLVDFGLDSLIKVRVVVNSPQADHRSIKLDKFDYDLEKSSTIRLDNFSVQVCKRIFDLVFALLFLLLVMSWLL